MLQVKTPEPVLIKLGRIEDLYNPLRLEQIPNHCGLIECPAPRRPPTRSVSPAAAACVQAASSCYHESAKLVVVMVGLPARGKSYTANKIHSFLQWLGINSRVFNVGSHRRRVLRDKVDQSARFFEESNVSARELRDKMAYEVFEKVLDWLDEGGNVAIFDATNSTNDRRNAIVEKAKHHPSVKLMFIENICTDPYVIADNVNQKVLLSPDYYSVSLEEAARDLYRRIVNYEQVYQTIKDDSLSYIKIVNMKSKIVCNMHTGLVPKMITDYVMSLHIHKRYIWFTRPGNFSVKPNEFTDMDETFSKKLTKFIHNRCADLKFPIDKLLIFTGTSTKLIHLANSITGATVVPTTTLNPLDMGVCHKMSPSQIAQDYPQVWSQWQEDRFNYRLPEGESFADLIQRLKPFVMELERFSFPILIISNAAPIKALYSYFKVVKVQNAPRVKVPKHTLIELNSERFGWNVNIYSLLNNNTQS